MSDNSKKLRNGIAKKPFTMEIPIDFVANGATIACHTIPQKLPAFHNVLNVDIAIEEALAGASATISVGFDDIDSEPDNLLADEAVASFATLTSAAGAVVAGIPRIGTDNTKVQVGASDAQLAYEIKTTALTAGKVTLLVTLIPTR